MAKPQPWKPADATDEIRRLANGEELGLVLTSHAREQMKERDLVVGDVTYILRSGFVYAEPETATRNGYYKYAMESRSPNSGSRTVRTIIIPDPERCHIKVVTVMWVD